MSEDGRTITKSITVLCQVYSDMVMRYKI